MSDDPSSLIVPDPQFLVSEEDIEEDVDGPTTRLHPSSHPHTHPTTTSHSKGVIFVERRGECTFMARKLYSSGISVRFAWWFHWSWDIQQKLGGLVSTKLIVKHSLVPRPPPFLPSVCVHDNTREQKTNFRRSSDIRVLLWMQMVDQNRECLGPRLSKTYFSASNLIWDSERKAWVQG